MDIKPVIIHQNWAKTSIQTIKFYVPVFQSKFKLIFLKRNIHSETTQKTSNLKLKWKIKNFFCKLFPNFTIFEIQHYNCWSTLTMTLTYLRSLTWWAPWSRGGRSFCVAACCSRCRDLPHPSWGSPWGTRASPYQNPSGLASPGQGGYRHIIMLGY